MALTQDQKATNQDTLRHIERVRNLLNLFAIELLKRGELHDQSKLVEPEVEGFTIHTKNLAGATYGSPEYQEFLKALKPTLDHHYANNRHHPEHYKNGIEDMNLVDIIEMLLDWKAASERHNDGNIRKSIEINAKRFNMSPQLVTICENTADLLFSTK
jgi:hypothetical protein